MHQAITDPTRLTLRATIGELRRLLTTLERLAARDGRTLDLQIMHVLEDCAPISTDGIQRLISRRRADVFATIKLMEQAGRVVRRNGKWEIADGETAQA